MSPVCERSLVRPSFPDWVADSAATNTGQNYVIILLQEDQKRNRPMVDSALGLLDAYGIWMGGMANSSSVTPLHIPVRERRRPSPVLARLSPQDLLKYLSRALSFGKSDLARVLHVSRQAVYDWIGGTPPSPENERRLRQIAQIASEFVSGTGVPIMRRFVVESLGGSEPSIIEMLEEDLWDEDRLQSALAEARDRTTQRKGSRPSAWLRSLGFPEEAPATKSANLDYNLTLDDWKRS